VWTVTGLQIVKSTLIVPGKALLICEHFNRRHWMTSQNCVCACVRARSRVGGRGFDNGGCPGKEMENYIHLMQGPG
jgi:hypothetical protein